MYPRAFQVYRLSHGKVQLDSTVQLDWKFQLDSTVQLDWKVELDTTVRHVSMLLNIVHALGD